MASIYRAAISPLKQSSREEHAVKKEEDVRLLKALFLTPVYPYSNTGGILEGLKGP